MIGWILVFCYRQFTLNAGLVKRRGSESCEGWVNFGSKLQKQLSTLQAARRACMTQRSAAMDGPYIHLKETQEMFAFDTITMNYHNMTDGRPKHL